MAVNTFFFKPVTKLFMLDKPEWPLLVLMQNTRVVTVPTAVIRKVGRRIAGWIRVI
jgi:hypothetical protein